MPAAGANQNEDMAEQDSIRRVAEHLNAADSEAAVCIICLELLKRQDAVWSCTDGCCDTVHLACIQVRCFLHVHTCNSSVCNGMAQALVLGGANTHRDMMQAWARQQIREADVKAEAAATR